MDFGVVQRVQGRSAHLAARFIARMGGSIRRFFRAVGYGGIIDLKAGSSELAWPVVGPLGVFHQSGREDNQELPVARSKQVAAIAAVCDRAATALFGRAVRRLVRWRAVFVAGFQAKLGLGAQLVKTLKSVRPDVQRKDVSGRDFAEILLSEPGQILSDADRRLTVSKADAGSGPCRSQAAQPNRTCHPPLLWMGQRQGEGTLHRPDRPKPCLADHLCHGQQPDQTSGHWRLQRPRRRGRRPHATCQ